MKKYVCLLACILIQLGAAKSPPKLKTDQMSAIWAKARNGQDLSMYQEIQDDKKIFRSGEESESSRGSKKASWNGKENRRNKPLPAEAELRQIATSEIKRIVPSDIADSVAITTVGYEMEQRDNGEPRVVGGFVRFHRLLNGLPVRGNSSYLELTFDSLSNLTDAEIRWPKYKEVRVKTRKTRNQLESKHRGNLDHVLNQMDAALGDNERNIEVEIYEAKETFRSWIAPNGDALLVPAITYVGKNRNSAKNEPCIFDIPMDDDMLSGQVEE